jgi:hypothetical protein
MPPRISAQITVEEDVPAANFALAVDNLNTSVNVHVRGSNHGARHGKSDSSLDTQHDARMY